MGNRMTSGGRTESCYRAVAHFSLTGSHRGGGVSLEGLDVGESFFDALQKIFAGDVLAKADKPLIARSFQNVRGFTKAYTMGSDNVFKLFLKVVEFFSDFRRL